MSGRAYWIPIDKLESSREVRAARRGRKYAPPPAKLPEA